MVIGQEMIQTQSQIKLMRLWLTLYDSSSLAEFKMQFHSDSRNGKK